MRSVGLDLGSKKIAFCEVENGKVVGRAIVSKVADLEDRLGPGTRPARIAIEASRMAWPVHAELRGWGHDVKLVDTTRVQLIGIGQHGRKNDSIDAERIAVAVERGTIPEAHLLSLPRQRLRHAMMTRRALVEVRTTLVTTIRGIAVSEGVSLGACSAENFVPMLAKRTLAEPLRSLIAPLATALVTVEQQLCVLDGRLEDVCAKEPVARLLMTTPGVGPVVAAMYISVLDDAKRFRQAREVTSYLGLVPREASSGGGRQRLGSITKHGNRYVRALLVQAAWVLFRTAPDDDPIKQWGTKVAERRGKTIAAVAIARRLAAVLWALWRRGVAYDPAHVAELSAKGFETNAAVMKGQAVAMQKVVMRTKARATSQARRASRERGRDGALTPTDTSAPSGRQKTSFERLRARRMRATKSAPDERDPATGSTQSRPATCASRPPTKTLLPAAASATDESEDWTVVSSPSSRHERC